MNGYQSKYGNKNSRNAGDLISKLEYNTDNGENLEILQLKRKTIAIKISKNPHSDMKFNLETQLSPT
jgi:hypothetical protein